MAIVIGNKTTYNATPAGTSHTISHNQNVGDDGVILVGLSMAKSRNYSSVTYNGVPLTQKVNYSSGGSGQRWALFTIENPATGVNNIVVNFNGSIFNPVSLIVQSFTGAEVGVTGNNDLSNTPHSRGLTVSENSLIYLMGVSANAQGTQYNIGGLNRPFLFGHNTNRTVRGALSDVLSAGNVISISKANFGQISNTRIEIKEVSVTPVGSSGNFLMLF
jgi:hypothetical protein